MDDWDADDFDESTLDQQLKSKAIDLGLEKVIKKEEPASHGSAASASTERNARMDALEAEKQSDLEAGMLLLGIQPEVKAKTFENLVSKKQLEDYANEVGESYKARSKDPNYMAFALPLVQHLCENMTKLQLMEVHDVIQGYITVFTKKEETTKKVEQQKKQQQNKKDKKKKLEQDGMVIDEYADYEDRF